MALALLVCGMVASASLAQRRRATASSATVQAQPGLLASLPTSDAVVQVDIQRLLNDALPRALAGDPARLAQVNAHVEQFKARTGIDVRAFDRIAVGMRFNNVSETVTKTSTVAIAHGSFNTGAIVAAGKLAANGQYKEQKYNGATLYIFSLNNQVKMLGLLNIRITYLAVAALNANALAMGDPDAVRAAIDANHGRGFVNSELVQLATRNPNAIIGFGANLPPAVTRNLRIDNDEIARNVSSIRQIYGSIATTANGFDTLAVARTVNADQAKNLSDTLTALRQFGSIFAARLGPPKDKFAQNALENLKISSQGNELQIRLEIAQTDLTTFMHGM